MCGQQSGFSLAATLEMSHVSISKFFDSLMLTLCVQSAEERVPVWYIMDEFGSQVKHSDEPSCCLAPFFYTQGQIAYSILWPLRDLSEGGESTHAHTFQERDSHETLKVERHFLQHLYLRTSHLQMK